ncbi:hypothetical protein B0H15DRAFT_803456 [Mycena belliarum]|uniref:Uncharacterized protein n=1 Tax=Mycena belliarum TaxID=1033014 RepID=A0AAD6XMU1_9AGAR|nr:hypothetical protein B0H15DRAFT_803456 [Mycena belliae]
MYASGNRNGGAPSMDQNGRLYDERGLYDERLYDGRLLRRGVVNPNRGTVTLGNRLYRPGGPHPSGAGGASGSSTSMRILVQSAGRVTVLSDGAAQLRLRKWSHPSGAGGASGSSTSIKMLGQSGGRGARMSDRHDRRRSADNRSSPQPASAARPSVASKPPPLTIIERKLNGWSPSRQPERAITHITRRLRAPTRRWTQLMCYHACLVALAVLPNIYITALRICPSFRLKSKPTQYAQNRGRAGLRNLPEGRAGAESVHGSDDTTTQRPFMPGFGAHLTWIHLRHGCMQRTPTRLCIVHVRRGVQLHHSLSRSRHHLPDHRILASTHPAWTQARKHCGSGKFEYSQVREN